MYKAEVIQGVVEDLYATEKAVDAAIAQATTLVQGMIAGRTELQVSPVAFAASQAKAMETIAALSEARNAIVAAHHEMAKDHRRMGWGVYATGPIDKPDDTTRPVERPWVQPDLRVAS